MSDTSHLPKKLVRDGRLVFLGKQPDVAFWQEWAERKSLAGQMTDASHQRLVPGVIRRFLSGGCRVLDAGCGTGAWLVLMRDMGYDAQGLEWSAPVVRKVASEAPALPIIVGDILALPYREETFDAYFSMGVVEHFEEGPHLALREARRVLKEGGIALIAVPFFNWLRKTKATLGSYKGDAGAEFYQYAFDAGEFSSILAGCGFRVIAGIPFAAGWGLGHEWPGVYRMRSGLQGSGGPGGQPDRVRPGLRRPIRSVARWLMESGPVRVATGHLILFVAQKAS